MGPPMELSEVIYQDNEGVQSHIDLLLVAKATKRNAQTLRRAVREYWIYFGQSINTQKSCMCISKRVRARVKQQVLNILNIPLHEGMWHYLGVPLSGNKLRRNDFNSLFDRIHNKLAAWKWRLLSQAGRITLIQSVLNSSYIYFLTNMPVPIRVSLGSWNWF